MSWLKADDKMHAHPKVKHIPRRLRLAALGLWLLCGTWSADYETDGVVPAHILDDFDADDELVEALVSAGLWDSAEDGIVFHDWAEYQPTRAVKAEKRAATAERVAKHRQSRRGAEKHRETPATSANGNSVTGGGVTPVYTPPVPEPVPERPTTPIAPEPLALEIPEEPRKRGGVYPDAFELWWASWPKRRSDSSGKKAAHASWERATRGTRRTPARVTAEALQAAVEAYASDANLPPEQFIPNATTWLNGDRWDNGPLPPRGGGRPDNLSQSLSVVAQLRAERESRDQITAPDRPALTRRTA